MLRKTYLILSLLISCAQAETAIAQSATASATAEAVIVRRLTFVKDEDLDFGPMLDGTTAGTVTVSPFNVRTATGGVTLAPGAFQASRFSGYGFVNQRVRISINATPITIRRYVNNVPQAETMIVRDFVIGSTPTAFLTTNPRIFRITSASGLFNFPVGATLVVGANQRSGAYVGTFTLTLDYI